MVAVTNNRNLHLKDVGTKAQETVTYLGHICWQSDGEIITTGTRAGALQTHFALWELYKQFINDI